MAKLRHIALIVPDPDKAAKFFEEAFDMKLAGRARRGVYMSDGTINVALLKQEGNEKVGIYHFGMWVDDLDEAETEGPEGRRHLSRRPADLAQLVLRVQVQGSARHRLRPDPQGLDRRRQGRGGEDLNARARIIMSNRVIVIGAGPVGLCLVARARAGGRQGLADRGAQRRQFP